jgi:DoxX-like family
LKRKIAYWLVLGLFLLMMTGSALAYLTGSKQMVDAFRHLGYPEYFRTMLGVAKLLGVLALVLPRVPVAVREWAYAGFGITMIAAVLSHMSSGEAARAGGPLFALILLVVARALWQEPAEQQHLRT